MSRYCDYMASTFYGVPIGFVNTSNGTLRVYRVNGSECYSLTELINVSLGKRLRSKENNGVVQDDEYRCAPATTEESKRFIISVPFGEGGKSKTYVPFNNVLDFGRSLHHGVLKTFILAMCGELKESVIDNPDRIRRPEKRTLLKDADDSGNEDKIDALERRLDKLTLALDSLVNKIDRAVAAPGSRCRAVGE